MRKGRWIVSGILCMLFFFGLTGLTLYAGTVYDSPYVTFSPDKKAFSTNEGDRDYKWYQNGMQTDTGVPSTLRRTDTGEHYYKYRRTGRLPVGRWEVMYTTGTCCHNTYYEGIDFHGIVHGKKPCGAAYYSGWEAFCADCGELIAPVLMYMSREAAETLTELDTSLDYYYLCPFCSNLEQGAGIEAHYCKEISWNRYQVMYDDNTSDWVGGYMENSIHMYNNETVYEGKQVTPATRLNKNTYTRTGYEFAGWNTRPDGSGQAFADQQQILNLTADNYDETGKGLVVLYAQWERSRSTLNIDAKEGTYLGKKGITAVTGDYGSSCFIDSSRLKPPDGKTITFDTQGGKELAPIKGQMVFQEWIMSTPFHGRFLEDTYFYMGKTGKTDTVTASYEYAAATLPGAQKEGSSFGGWYYDRECTIPAGSAGDKLTPKEDTVLYAKWVSLVLKAEDNYSAFSGTGAVDLAWEQKDSNVKTYLIYQSEDNKSWTRVSGAEDISNQLNVNRKLSFQEKEQSITVPYTGMYTLTCNGAQGGSFGSNQGGQGGSVTGRVWLNKGEKLSFVTGGVNGYNGGGKGSSYGGGGGFSSVRSDQKGILMIAGGGGGATSLDVGGKGGSQTNTVLNGNTGQSGEAGGGGGHRGGQAGEVIRHYHSESCYRVYQTEYTYYRGSQGGASDIRKNFGEPFGWFTNPNAQYVENVSVGSSRDPGGYGSAIQMGGHTKGEQGGMWLYLRDDRGRELIPAEGNTEVYIYWWKHNWSDPGGDLQLYVYDQNGTQIYYENTSGETNGEVGRGSSIRLPQGTTDIKIRLYNSWGANDVAWLNMGISEVRFSGGSRKERICAYRTDGEIVSVKPAYGGSSYVNTDWVTGYTMEAGKNKGNGSASLASVQIGYVNELSLPGVRARDKAAPDTISESTVRKEVMDESHILVSFQEPEDKGTAYYHRAESYSVGKTELLGSSNVTVNTLISGIQGYYCLIDSLAQTKLSKEHGDFYKEAAIPVTLGEEQQYLHIAPVDRASNLGKTVHIPIGKKQEEAPGDILTSKIEIASDEGAVWAFGEENTYYVRCDGGTSFALSFSGLLKDAARVDYQVGHMIYHMKSEQAQAVELQITAPLADRISDRNIVTRADGLTRTVTGQPQLADDGYTVAERSEYCRRLWIEQRFVMEPQYNGKKLCVTPVAGADYKGEIVRSEWAQDEKNSIWLIGDSTAPDITGTEAMKTISEQKPQDGKRTVTVYARDEGSGLRELYAEVVNLDNGSRKVFEGRNGAVVITADEQDVLFEGDFTTEFHATDNVGNEQVILCRNEGFSLSASVYRILAPHNPVFRCGESGKLTILTYGYADRVEVSFPEEFTDRDPFLDRVFEYETSELRKEEVIDFMVPLRVPMSKYTITVTAYKDGKMLKRTPILWTLGETESVLNDLRTRLR